MPSDVGQDLKALAAQAFIYGFPLVFDLQEVANFERKGLGEVPPTPFNEFGHGTSVGGARVEIRLDQ